MWQGKTFNLETLSRGDYDTLNKAIQSPATQHDLIESLNKMIEAYCATMPSGYTALHKAVFKLFTKQEHDFSAYYPYMSFDKSGWLLMASGNV